MMKITISHTKNVVIGWNIDVSVEADDYFLCRSSCERLS
jgi:hypothetical protein